MHPQRLLRFAISISILMLCSACATAAKEKPAFKSPTMTEVLAAAKDSDWRDLDPANTLYLTLPKGRVVIELAPAFAPNHVANVKTLVGEHYFDGLAIIRSQDNYVVQWGDPNATEPEKARKMQQGKSSLKAEFSIGYGKDFPFTLLPDGDGYAPRVGFSYGFAAARDPASKQTWLTHCYGAVGAGRDVGADSGSGAELYVVNGHAPRHLDRNVTVIGRVLQGMDLLSTLPRGTGALGFYEKPEELVPITSIRVAADLSETERLPLQVLRTDTDTWSALVESRRNRRDEWYLRAAGHVELCNVPIPVRLRPTQP
jgi:peptidylprolyl isomerase